MAQAQTQLDPYTLPYRETLLPSLPPVEVTPLSKDTRNEWVDCGLNITRAIRDLDSQMHKIDPLAYRMIARDLNDALEHLKHELVVNTINARYAQLIESTKKAAVQAIKNNDTPDIKRLITELSDLYTKIGDCSTAKLIKVTYRNFLVGV